MSMKRKSLEELNLLDDFLFQELITRGEQGEEACRILLSTILGKPIGRVRVLSQKMVPGIDTDLHGIRLDAYIEAVPLVTTEDVELETAVYDIEPNKTREKESLPRRTRYYHGLMDARLLDAGQGYDTLKNVVIIMILPYDPFDRNRMVYTIKNRCLEEPDLPYEDGTETIYLYTRGIKEPPSQKLQEMLKYMESSTAENVTNRDIASLHGIVSEIRRDREVGIQYMKSWEREQMIREEATRAGMQKGRQAGLQEGLQEGRQEGLQEGRQAGLQEGRQAGLQEAEDQISRLILKLSETGRLDDIVRAASDRTYQRQLLEEFGLLAMSGNEK